MNVNELFQVCFDFQTLPPHTVAALAQVQILALQRDHLVTVWGYIYQLGLCSHKDNSALRCASLDYM